MADGFTDFPIFLISLVAAGAVIASLFISKLVRRVTIPIISNADVTEQSKISQSNCSKKSSSQSQLNKSSIKKKYGDKNIREGKQSFNHQWLLTSLKGHSSAILDMEFSPNGKLLATCGEEGTNEPDPGGGDGSGSSSGSEGNKENSAVSKELPARKQKKNRGADGSPKKVTRKMKRTNRWMLSDGELSAVLRNYILTPEQIVGLGYPIESSLHPGRAIIYKTASPRGPIEQCQIPRLSHPFDVNAREFVPSPKRKSTDRKEKISDSLESSESGEASKSSNEEDSDDKDSDKDVSQSIIQRILDQSDEKRCVRCGRGFVMVDGEYLTQEKCVYHWGKLQRVYGAGTVGTVSVRSEFSCCNGRKNSKGCTVAKLHVWNGVDAGVNGPLDGYVKTKPRRSPPDGNHGVYSMDCEMCYTTRGLELAKITLVSTDGRTVYDSYVKPDSAIIDYNTRFSGITAKDLKKGNSAKCLREVQNDLMSFISADTILIGHALENDLKALKMIHSTVIDTSVIFPHYYGLPYRRSLRSLVNSILKRDIQSCGHDSFEDAKACMELMLWRVKKDFRNNFEPKICDKL